MTAATIVMAYYENPNMLQMQCVEWSMYRDANKKRLSVIIVDDGSPRSPAEHVLRQHGSVGFPILLFRIKENKPWNQDGARNLAMKHATGWTLMTDMDHMLGRDQVEGLGRCVNGAQRGEYYMPARMTYAGAAEHPHANSYVMFAEDFWSLGGYDEDFSGVYGSDGNFRKCMRAGLRECTTKAFHLTRWDRHVVPDASTTDWSRKDGPYHRSNFPALENKRKGPAYYAVDHLRFNWERVI